MASSWQSHDMPSAVHLVSQNWMGMHAMYCRILHNRQPPCIATARNSWTGFKTATSLPKYCCMHRINLPCLACPVVVGLAGHVAAAVEGCVPPEHQVIICYGMLSLCDYYQFCSMSKTYCSLGAPAEYFCRRLVYLTALQACLPTSNHMQVEQTITSKSLNM